MAILKMEHIGIKVENLERSITFYTKIIGMELLNKLQPNEDVSLAFLGFPSQNTVIELVEGSKSELANEGKVSHLAFTVENIKEEVEQLKKLDIVFKTEEISTLPNGASFIFFEGPDKELLELFEPAK